MTHREKVRFMMEDLEKRGVGRWTSAPPLFRLLWHFGSRARPPLFPPWVRLVLLYGVPYGVFMSMLTFWVMPRPAGEMALLLVLVGGPLMGAGFGVGQAIAFRYRASKLGLPPWESYGFDTRAPEVFS